MSESPAQTPTEGAHRSGRQVHTRQKSRPPTPELLTARYFDAATRVSALAEDHDSWIKDEPAKLATFWKQGTLFRRLLVERDTNDMIVGESEGNLVLAGERGNNEYLGLELFRCVGKNNKAYASSLVQDGRAIFVVDPRSKMGRAFVASSPGACAHYYIPDEEAVYVAELCYKSFSNRDHFQLVAPGPAGAREVTAEHWSIAESAAKAKDQTAAKQAKASRPQVWDKPSSMYAGRASGSDLFPPEMRSAGILQQDHVTFTDGGDGTIGADPDRLAGVFDTLVGVSVSKAGGVVSSKRKRLAAVVENGEEEEEEGRASQRQGQQAERGFKKKIKTVGGNIQAHDDGPQGAGDKKALSQGSIDAENEHKLPMRPLAQGAHDGEETEPAVEDVQAQGDGTQDVGNERVEQQDPTLKVALPTKMRA